MSEPTHSNLDRTSEWGTRRNPAPPPSPSSDTAPGFSAGDQTSAFTAAEPIDKQAAARAAASPFAAPQAVSLPCDFGDYELLAEIAHGGMGVVYKARQKSLDRIVALKMILPHMVATEIAVKRFYLEAMSAAKLEHPNIVPIYEIKELHGRHYFTMAFIEGSTLKARVADHVLSRKEILELFLPIVEAVAFAHEKGIIHRDLKPDNVLLDGRGRPRITDFGLAKDPTSGKLDLTSTGQILGTPAYMAPEQALAGDRKIGPEADVYALGSILYFLFTGEPPFGGKSVTEILFRVVNEPVPAMPPRVGGDLADLDAICRKCLAKSPAARYSDGRSLLAALREVPADRAATPAEMVHILGPTSSRCVDPAMLIAKPTPAAKKSRSAALIAVGALASLAIVVAVTLLYLKQTPAGPVVPSNPKIASSYLAPVFAKSDINVQVTMTGGNSQKLPDGVYHLHDNKPVALDVVADKDAHFAIWAMLEDGNILQLFPNDNETDNSLKAGVHRMLPGPNAKWEFTPSAAKGIEYLRVFASTRPLALDAVVEKHGEFLQFAQNKGEFNDMLRGIQVTAKPDQKNGETVVPFHVSEK